MRRNNSIGKATGTFRYGDNAKSSTRQQHPGTIITTTPDALKKAVMERIRGFFDNLILGALVVQGIVLVGIICLAVFFRYVMGAALSWPEEVAGIIFVWYTLLGVVALASSNSHIAFDTIEKYSPRVVARFIKALSQVIIILYGLIMVVYGWKYLRAFPYETSPAAGINLVWLKSAIPLAGVLIVVYVSLNLLADFNASSRDNNKDNT